MMKTAKIFSIFAVLATLTSACASRPTQGELASQDETTKACRKVSSDTNQAQHLPYLHPGLLSF